MSISDLASINAGPSVTLQGDDLVVEFSYNISDSKNIDDSPVLFNHTHNAPAVCLMKRLLRKETEEKVLRAPREDITTLLDFEVTIQEARPGRCLIFTPIPERTSQTLVSVGFETSYLIRKY